MEMKTDNELIAEFMELPLSIVCDTGHEVLEQPLGYDNYFNEWNNLMPVIERICNLWRENVDQYNTPPPEQREWDRRGSKVGMLTIDCGIQAAYINVVEFIKWYNQQSK